MSRWSGNRWPAMLFGLICISLGLTSCSRFGLQVSQSPKSSPLEVERQVSQAAESASSRKSQAPAHRTLDELLLFQPSQHPDGNWEPRQLDYIDHYFDSKDGTRIHSWYCPVVKPVAVVLYLHGNAGNLSHRAPLMRKLQKLHRVSAMIVDYRGYGRSNGKPTAQGTIEDAEVARAELAKLAGVEESDNVLMGRSLGGAIAIQLAAQKAPKGLIVESSFTSLKEIAKHHFPKLAWLVSKDKLDSRTALGNYKGPVLISHGNRDRVIPFHMGRTLFDTASGTKKFVTIPNANHNDPQTVEYDQAFGVFLGSLGD